MILVDTSIWIDHFRSAQHHLIELLERRLVATHEMIIGELACGNLRHRETVLAALNGMPKCISASHDEVLYFIERHHLMGRGIGYVDACLLAGAALSDGRLWTGDKRLGATAIELNLAYLPA